MVKIAEVFYNKVTDETHTTYDEAYNSLSGEKKIDILTATILEMIKRKQELIRIKNGG